MLSVQDENRRSARTGITAVGVETGRSGKGKRETIVDELSFQCMHVLYESEDSCRYGNVERLVSTE